MRVKNSAVFVAALATLLTLSCSKKATSSEELYKSDELSLDEIQGKGINGTYVNRNDTTFTFYDDGTQDGDVGLSVKLSISDIDITLNPSPNLKGTPQEGGYQLVKDINGEVKTILIYAAVNEPPGREGHLNNGLLNAFLIPQVCSSGLGLDDHNLHHIINTWAKSVTAANGGTLPIPPTYVASDASTYYLVPPSTTPHYFSSPDYHARYTGFTPLLDDSLCSSLKNDFGDGHYFSLTTNNSGFDEAAVKEVLTGDGFKYVAFPLVFGGSLRDSEGVLKKVLIKFQPFWAQYSSVGSQDARDQLIAAIKTKTGAEIVHDSNGSDYHYNSSTVFDTTKGSFNQYTVSSP